MAEVGAELSASRISFKNPYRMSVSFGLVNSTDYHDVDEMITEADRRMYEYKKKMKKRIAVRIPPLHRKKSIPVGMLFRCFQGMLKLFF